MRLKPMHYMIEEPNEDNLCVIEQASGSAIPDASDDHILLLIYTGHGSRDDQTHEWKLQSTYVIMLHILELFVMLTHSSEAGIHFNEALGIMYDLLGGVRDTFIVLDACDSGSAAQGLRRSKNLSFNPNLNTIAFLSASSWNTITPAHGNDTLTKRFASATSQLMNEGLPISALAIQDKILQTAIETDVGCPMFDFAGGVVEDLVLKTGIQDAFAYLHGVSVAQEAFDVLPWLKRRPDLGGIVCIVHADYELDNLEIKNKCYVDWIPWYKDPTVAETISDWRRLQILSVKMRVRLEYFGKILHDDLDLIDSLQFIKKQQDGLDVSTQHLYVLTAFIEDDSNPFGGSFEGCVVRNSRITFGQYMSKNPLVVALLRDKQPLSIGRKKAMRPIVEYYEKGHAESQQKRRKLV